MIVLIVSTVLLICVSALPQQGGYNYNRSQFNQPQSVLPLPSNPGQAQSQSQRPPQSQYNLAPQSQQGFIQSRNNVPITSYNNEVSHDGSYSYSYSTGDGTQAQAQGYLKNAGNKDLEAQVVQGSYSYISPDGTPISVKYIADENGFRADGLHLPTPPPIPEAIAKSLQFIARAQSQQNNYNQYQNQYSGNNQGYNKFGGYN